MGITANAYSDDNGSDISLTQFLDYLSFNYKGFDIKVKEVSIVELYDDNVTYSTRNKLDDFVTNMGVGFGIDYEGKAKYLSLTGNVTNQTFAQNNEFNNITQNINLIFNNEFSEKSRMRLQNVFTHTDAPLFNVFQEGVFDQEFERKSGRFDYFQNRFDVDYAHDIAKVFSVIGRYSNDLDMFSGSDLINSVQHKVGFETDYLFSSVTTFLFSYDFANRRFETDEDVSINTVAAGIKQVITQKVYFEGRAGFDFVDNFDGDNIISPIVLSSVVYEMDVRTRVRLAFEKKYNTNPYFIGLFNRWKTSVSLRRQLLERLGSSFSTFYGEGEGVPTGFKSRHLGASTALVYDITKNLKGNVIYTYSQSETLPNTAEYTKNTLFFGLTLEF